MLLFLSAICAATMASAAGVDRINSVLDRKIGLFSTANADEFPEFCKEYRLPCGEERFEEKSFEQTPYYVFRKTNLTGRAILDEIVKRHPDYAWKIEDGVLVFAPRDRNASILERRVSHFEARSKVLDEVIFEAGSPAGVFPGAWGHSGYVDPERLKQEHLDSKKKIDVRLDNASIRQILNSAVSTHGYATWLVMYSRGKASNYLWAWFPITRTGYTSFRVYIY